MDKKFKYINAKFLCRYENNNNINEWIWNISIHLKPGVNILLKIWNFASANPKNLASRTRIFRQNSLHFQLEVNYDQNLASWPWDREKFASAIGSRKWQNIYPCMRYNGSGIQSSYKGSKSKYFTGKILNPKDISVWHWINVSEFSRKVSIIFSKPGPTAYFCCLTNSWKALNSFH